MKTTVLENQEVYNLVKLLDDSDEEVINIVTQKLVSLGEEALSVLQEKLLQGENYEISEKILSVCHEITKNILVADFKSALSNLQESGSILPILYAITKIEYEDIEWGEFEKPILDIQKLLWLETHPQFNNFEKSYLLSKILYEHLHYEFSVLSYNRVQDFYLWNLLKTKKGNTFSLGFLFLLCADFLNLPIAPYVIPNHILLAKVESHKFESYKQSENFQLGDKDIVFFIDPAVGVILNLRQVKKFIFENYPDNKKLDSIKVFTMEQLIKYYLRNLEKAYMLSQQTEKYNTIKAFLHCF